MIFNENKLQEEIIKNWGEFGSHNEVFKAMTLQIKELKEQLNLSSVSQQRELLTFLEEVASDDRHMSSARIRERAEELIKVNCG